MKKFQYVIIVPILLILPGCAKQAQIIPPTVTPISPTATVIPPTNTPTETPTTLPFVTLTPEATIDLTLFGAIGQNEIQAFALESVANAIFKQTFDGYVAEGRIQEYQVTRVSVFPGSGGLLSEIIFNVRTSDTTWLEDGGTQVAGGWINDKCFRFDFVTTDTEFQLKNRRMCG